MERDGIPEQSSLTSEFLGVPTLFIEESSDTGFLQRRSSVTWVVHEQAQHTDSVNDSCESCRTKLRLAKLLMFQGMKEDLPGTFGGKDLSYFSLVPRADVPVRFNHESNGIERENYWIGWYDVYGVD